MKFENTVLRTLFFSFLLSFSHSSAAFSLLEWLGFGGEKETSSEMSGKTVAKVEKKEPISANENKMESMSSEKMISLGEINSELEIGEMKLILANLTEEKRKELLSDPEKFSLLVKQQLALKSILKAMMANHLHNNPNSQFLMQKSAENTLRQIYVNRLISQKIPGDFPSDEQVESFYNDNKEKFTIGERIHLWQIFLPFGKEADIDAINALEKQAESIKKDLEKSKTTFAAAAEKNSSHLPSRYNGGYMGLVKVSDLIPAIKERVISLEEGKLSKLIKTENGIHIMKRGALIPAQQLSLEQSKGQIRNALRQEASKRLRQAIVEQAQESYPSEMDDKKIEEWRLKLRTNL